MDESEIIKNIKLVEVKDIWMSRGIMAVDINDDCKTLKEIFDSGSSGVLVQDVSEFGDQEIVGWITKVEFEKFETVKRSQNFKENSNCKVGDIKMDRNFDRIAPAATVLAAELKLKKTNSFALPIIAVHFGRDIGMGYITLEDIENIKRKYNK